jgi:hypothetical protein
MTSNTKNNRPDDKPFDFNLNTVKCEVDLSPFVVIAGDNKRYSFTHLKELNVWDLVEGADRGDMAQGVQVFKTALGTQFDDFKKLPLPQYKLEALFEAYEKFCGVEPGESESSTDS